MWKSFTGALSVLALGLASISVVPGPARAADTNEYVLFGCAETFLPPDFVELSFVVVFSSSPDEVGKECETVLNSLGSQGFRLVETAGESIGGAAAGPGVLHYMERSTPSGGSDEDD